MSTAVKDADAPSQTGTRSILANLRHDFPASLVVFLVALPLSLGIAINFRLDRCSSNHCRCSEFGRTVKCISSRISFFDLVQLNDSFLAGEAANRNLSPRGL